MNHPEWFSKDYDVKICDDVLFWKQDGALSNSYHYSMVNEIVPSKVGVICKVAVWYRNHQENLDWYTTRAISDLMLFHPIDELNLMERLRKVT